LSKITFTPYEPIEDATTIIQETLDLLNGGSKYIQTYSELFDFRDLEYPNNNFPFSLNSNSLIASKKMTKITSKYLTNTKNYTQAPRQILHTYANRYLNKQKLRSLAKEDGLPDIAIDFADTFFVENYAERMTDMNNPAWATYHAAQWLASKSTNKASELKHQMNDPNFEKAQGLNKAYTQWKEKENYIEMDKADQGVTFYSKNYNAKWCPIMREIQRRIKQVLRPNIEFHFGYNDTEWNDILNQKFTEEPLYTETDLSEQDASQDRIVREAEIELLKLLGFEPEYQEEFKNGLTYWKLTIFVCGLKCVFEGIKKSGEPHTLLGNTMNNALYSNHYFDLKKFVKQIKKLLILKGDDFLACGVLKLRTGPMAIKNLFPHVLIKKEVCCVPTFCSQIILKFGGKFIMIPNPDKYLNKLLGKRFSHAEIKHKLPALHISIADIYGKFCNYELLTLLPEACSIRYRKPVRAYKMALDILLSFIKHPETLHKIFVKEISYYY
jgi:hypothetical protein